MNSMERTLTTLGQKEPDRVPLFLLTSMHGAKETGLSLLESFARADTIIEGCERYARSIEANKTDRQFVKLAATWLNKRCWEDEHFISPPGTRQPTIGQTIDSLSAALSIVNTRTA